MNGKERRKKIIEILKGSDSPVSGLALAKAFAVSRQVIVQDIALLRAENIKISSTNRGYLLEGSAECSRIFKVHHQDCDTAREMEAIVDMGGWIKDVFVYHRVYGVLRAQMNIHSRRDIRLYMENLKDSKSTPLMNITSGYHYHTVYADNEETLDEIQEELWRLGFLAKLQEYEPVEFPS